MLAVRAYLYTRCTFRFVVHNSILLLFASNSNYIIPQFYSFVKGKSGPVFKIGGGIKNYLRTIDTEGFSGSTKIKLRYVNPFLDSHSIFLTGFLMVNFILMLYSLSDNSSFVFPLT